jgi:uncharacterized protein YdeI (YjbR/CyaY-like superfamily)
MPDPRIDAYIAKAQPFARPILRKIRALVHEVCPDVREEIKWSFPHFDYKGMFCGMAAFKAHCSLGFWKHGLLAKQGLVTADRDGMGSFGRFTSLSDMPSDAELRRVLRAAKALNDAGVSAPRAKAKPKPPLRVPAYVSAALKKDRKAAGTFKELSPSHRREYVEWIVDAKTDETRARRMDKMVAQLASGQSLNAKYDRRKT